MEVATIGFAGNSADVFFRLLRSAKIRAVLDVRLHNTSQLAGFAKKTDLPFFLRELTGASYLELPDLAPEPSLLKRYRAKELSWGAYAAGYQELLASRGVERTLDAAVFDRGCLLCSEHFPDKCHRRIAVEYLNYCWGNHFSVTHLV